MRPTMTLASSFDVAEAFLIMCKIAIDAGVSRREMESAIELTWRMKGQLDALPSVDASESPSWMVARDSVMINS